MRSLFRNPMSDFFTEPPEIDDADQFGCVEVLYGGGPISYPWRLARIDLLPWRHTESFLKNNRGKIGAIIAFALLVSPVRAETISGEVYAKSFCELRSSGMPEDQAISTALRISYLPGDNWTMMDTGAGKKYRSDLVFAVRSAISMCPFNFK